jgi:hypothetical protein
MEVQIEIHIDENHEIALTQILFNKARPEAGFKIHNIKQNSSIKRQGEARLKSQKSIVHSGFMFRHMVTLRRGMEVNIV